MRKYTVTKQVISEQVITASSEQHAIEQAVKRNEWVPTNETVSAQLIATDEQAAIYELFEKDDDK
jgi:hypothetical protein